MTEPNPKYIEPEFESASSMARNILIGLGVATVTGVVAGGVVAVSGAIKKQHSEKAADNKDDPNAIHDKYLEKS